MFAVPVAVQRDRVAGRDDLPASAGSRSTCSPQRKKVAVASAASQRLEHRGRALRMGAVVEGERHALGVVDPPRQRRGRRRRAGTMGASAGVAPGGRGSGRADEKALADGRMVPLMDGEIGLGFALALAAACCYETGYALQAIEARRAPADRALRPSLMTYLLRTAALGRRHALSLLGLAAPDHRPDSRAPHAGPADARAGAAAPARTRRPHPRRARRPEGDRRGGPDHRLGRRVRLGGAARARRGRAQRRARRAPWRSSPWSTSLPYAIGLLAPTARLPMLLLVASAGAADGHGGVRRQDRRPGRLRGRAARGGRLGGAGRRRGDRRRDQRVDRAAALRRHAGRADRAGDADRDPGGAGATGRRRELEQTPRSAARCW